MKTTITIRHLAVPDPNNDQMSSTDLPISDELMV